MPIEELIQSGTNIELRLHFLTLPLGVRVKPLVPLQSLQQTKHNILRVIGYVAQPSYKMMLRHNHGTFGTHPGQAVTSKNPCTKAAYSYFTKFPYRSECSQDGGRMCL